MRIPCRSVVDLCWFLLSVELWSTILGWKHHVDEKLTHCCSKDAACSLDPQGLKVERGTPPPKDPLRQIRTRPNGRAEGLIGISGTQEWKPFWSEIFECLRIEWPGGQSQILMSSVKHEKPHVEDVEVTPEMYVCCMHVFGKPLAVSWLRPSSFWDRSIRTCASHVTKEDQFVVSYNMRVPPLWVAGLEWVLCLVLFCDQWDHWFM